MIAENLKERRGHCAAKGEGSVLKISKECVFCIIFCEILPSVHCLFIHKRALCAIINRNVFY